MLAGMLAGLATATIHLTLKLNTLLCGILVLTMLFSIDIRIMGKPNIALFAYSTLFDNLLGTMTNLLSARIVLVGALLAIVTFVLGWFLRTEIGMALRAVGASQSMARAQGLSVARYTLLGLGLAGALCALAGALLAQNQAFADVGMGFGVLVNGLASVIVGEQLIGRATLGRQLVAPVIGLLSDRQSGAGRRPATLRSQARHRHFRADHAGGAAVGEVRRPPEHAMTGLRK